MKKLLSAFLCAALLTGMAAPALAADTADTRLTRVTQTVKATLGLDTEQYESFQGNCYEQELASVWTLEWSDSTRSLTVEALEDGTVVNYRLYELEDAGVEPSGIPSLPVGTPEAAKSAAVDFLKKVLDPAMESVDVGDARGINQLDRTTYTFSGEIRLYGLSSPLSYSVTVRATDGQVVRFRRSVPETLFLGDVPSATPAASQSKAAESLKSTLALRLEYVLDTDGTAVLRYLPEDVHSFYVDAQTGKLVDLTELQEKMYTSAGGDANSNASPESAAAADRGKGLTEAEQEGISKLEDVLDKETINTVLQAVSEYGISRYTLASAGYQLTENDDGEQVLCTLQYNRSAEEGVYSRRFTVDARTGEVLSLWSTAPWDDARKPSLTVKQAQARAEVFLKAYYGEHYETLALYETVDNTDEGSALYSFTFARKENGYFFPANAYNVSIDVSDGSVSRLSFVYDEDMVFDDVDGLITAEAAVDAWMGTYETSLDYLLVPEKLDGTDPVAARLTQMGWTYYYTLKLGYSLEREQYYLGIDAKSGEPVAYADTESSELKYNDLAGHWAQSEIELLARYQVGYAAESFQPDKALTQLDAVCLLASLQGWLLDPATADEQSKDQVYNIAYTLGALTRQERQDDAVLTRGELVKLLLNSAGYGKVAMIEGIFTCAYADRASIPAADLGYAALAQGLGLVRGAYDGAQTANRAEAAVMLIRLMAN